MNPKQIREFRNFDQDLSGSPRSLAPAFGPFGLRSSGSLHALKDNVSSASPTLEKCLALVSVAKAATERPSCDELGGDFLLPVLN